MPKIEGVADQTEPDQQRITQHDPVEPGALARSDEQNGTEHRKQCPASGKHGTPIDQKETTNQQENAARRKQSTAQSAITEAPRPYAIRSLRNVSQARAEPISNSQKRVNGE